MSVQFLEVSDKEPVVLVDESGKPIGEMSKGLVHHAETPLHLAFSVFVFDSRGRLLVQQRALHKRTWPGVWSNSVCGHPLPGEGLEAAIARRMSHEIGLEGVEVFEVLPRFRYRACWDGIWENEMCPVYIGFSDAIPSPNPAEVECCDWVDWGAFSTAAARPERTAFEDYSPWSMMEAAQLLRSSRFANLMAANLFSA